MLQKSDGAPGGIRTPDGLIRSQPLYPAEVRAQSRLLRINIKKKMAEEVGFEPTVRCRTTVFKTAAFNRSATPPSFDVATLLG